MMCGVVVCVADGWVCSQFGGEGKAVGHVGMGVVSGVLGAGLFGISC
jgi:hypothetical protein